MSVFKLISKWNNSSETFRAQQYILNLAKEEDLVKIEEAIKQRREELAKKAPQKQRKMPPIVHIPSILKDHTVNFSRLRTSFYQPK